MSGCPGAVSGQPSDYVVTRAPAGTVAVERGLSGHDSSARATFHDWPLSNDLELGPLPTAVPCARAHTLAVLHEWGLAELADDAGLLVSELVTNALDASQALPARPPFLLRLLASPPTLLIEVWDQSPDNPQPCAGDALSECGRGLQLVEALSAQWGYRRTGYAAKVVWCLLPAS